MPPLSKDFVVLLTPVDGDQEAVLTAAAWQNFIDTDFFLRTLSATPPSESALNVFDWEFDFNSFSVASPPKRFGGTDVVTFEVTTQYELTQTLRAYVKFVLVDRSNGNRRLDSAFVRATAGLGLITTYLQFDPSQVNGSVDLAVESYIMQDGFESPNQTAVGWRYVPNE